MCHSRRIAGFAATLALAGTLSAGALTGCAAKVGWSVTPARTCEHRAPPRVCVLAEPDYGHVLALADVELLPGECAVAPGVGGGLLRVTVRDREGRERTRTVSTPRGRFTVVAVDEAGRLAVEHPRCDQRPVSLPSAP